MRFEDRPASHGCHHFHIALFREVIVPLRILRALSPCGCDDANRCSPPRIPTRTGKEAFTRVNGTSRSGPEPAMRQVIVPYSGCEPITEQSKMFSKPTNWATVSDCGRCKTSCGEPRAMMLPWSRAIALSPNAKTSSRSCVT